MGRGRGVADVVEEGSIINQMSWPEQSSSSTSSSVEEDMGKFYIGEKSEWSIVAPSSLTFLS